MSVAGHAWRRGGLCDCGKRLADIAYAAYDSWWLGKPDISHRGGLTLAEQVQIAEAVDKIYATRYGGCVAVAPWSPKSATNRA